MNLPLFTSATCTTAAAAAAADTNGHKRDTLQTERGTCALVFFITGVASRYKHVHECRHGLSLGSVEVVDAAAMTAEFEDNPCSLWRLNAKRLSGVAGMP